MARAKKSLGQHFLQKQSIAQRIAGAVHTDTPLIVEIGPGHGILTAELLTTGKRLVLIEKDDALFQEMQERYASASQVTVVHADFLRFPLDTLGDRFSLAGNFPYNISSQIVFRMLEHRDRIPGLVGMFQLEMARRIVAAPGSKDYGVLSVLTQLDYDGVFLFNVSPTAFKPPPKVQSAVIRLTRKPKDEIMPVDRVLFKTVVKRTFGQRRKMLRNTLRGLIPDTTLKDDPFYQQRPEQLSVEMFCKLVDIAHETSNPE